MKKDSLKPGEGGKEQEGKVQARKKEVFFVTCRNQRNSLGKVIPLWYLNLFCPVPGPSSFPALFLWPAEGLPSRTSRGGVGPRTRGWARTSCGARAHKEYEGPAKEGGEGGLELAKRKQTKALSEREKSRTTYTSRLKPSGLEKSRFAFHSALQHKNAF